jgi:outer membrane protein TolC
VEIAQVNYQNSDTLYLIAKGRYKLGTIAEDEVLNMELSYLNAKTDLKSAEMNLRDAEIRLKSFLGFNENVSLKLLKPTDIPDLQVNVQEVLDLAHANNPNMLEYELDVLNARMTMAEAKANRGLNADLVLTYGLDDSDSKLNKVYDNPVNSQGLTIGLQMPILDWGLKKGKYLMAKSSLELAQVTAEQSIADFDQTLYLDVEQFNLQRDMVSVAARSDTVAMKMYEVTKQRFLIGKIDVLDLINANSEKDSNGRAFVQALQDYWQYFYTVRSLAIYDFLNKKPIETEYDKLLE